jgi:hypothetical protein
LFYIAKNYLWGIGHIFSVSNLLRTLFVPWRRMSSHTARLFEHPLEFLGDVLVNITMRLLGFFVRSIILSLALLSAILIVVLFALLYVSWTLLPLVLISLLIQAVSLLLV